MAGVHLLVWLRNREYLTNLAFALAAIGAAVTAVFELALMHSQTIAQYGQILRWLHLPLFVLVVSFIWFVGLYLKAGRAWLLWSFLAIRALILVVDLASVPNVSFQEITALHFVTIWGDTFAAAAGIMSPWRYLIRFGDVLLLLFIADASYTAWKKGRRRQALITGAIFFVVVSIAVASSVVLGNGMLRIPLILSMPFLLVILVIGVDMSLDLSRVQKISRELRENQERIRLAAKAVNLGIWEWDIPKDEIWATEVGRERIGVRDDEKISIERFLQSVHPEDREKVRADVRRTKEGTGTSEPEAEYRVIAEDGTLRWISSRGIAEGDLNGRAVLVRGVTVDITTRKKAEEELRESLERYRAMVEVFDGFTYICSPDFRIEFMNQRLIERTGRNAVGEPCYEALHGKNSICEWCVNEKLFRGETVRWEVQSPKDHRWYYVVNTPIRHVDGTISKQSMITDITERKQAEDALRESEEKFRALMEQSPVAISIYSPDGAFRKANAAFAKLFNFSRETLAEFCDKYNLLQDEQVKRMGNMPLVEKILAGEVVDFPPTEYDTADALKSLEFNEHKAGKNWVHVTGFPLKDKDGNVTRLVLLSEDITERRKAEQQILDHQNRLKALASQLTLVEEQERRRIAADLHDDIGQTLAITRLQLAAAIGTIDDTGLKEKLDEVSKTLLKATKDTRQLIFELSSPIISEHGLGAAISEWIDEKMNKRNGVEVELVDKLEGAAIDQDLQIILFRNVREFLTNIIKHANADRVSVVLEKVKNEIRITVQDNGIGFEPHRIAGNISQDGGFGLFSVQERMADLGGKLEIRSAPHRGSTMIMTLSCNGITERTSV